MKYRIDNEKYNMEDPTVNGNFPESPHEQQTTDHKAQPWKKHWPPQTEASAGEAHGTQKGAVMQGDGQNAVLARLPRPLN
jgi:hypothetical protein